MADYEREVVLSFDVDEFMIKTPELVAWCFLIENREKFEQILRNEMQNAAQDDVDEVIGFLKKIEGETALEKDELYAALHLCEKSQLMRNVIKGMVAVDEIPLNEGAVELMRYCNRNRMRIIMITSNEETDLIWEIARRKGVRVERIFVEHGDKSARVEQLMVEMGCRIVHFDNDPKHKRSFDNRFGQYNPHFVLAVELDFHSLKNAMDDAVNRLSNPALSQNLLRDSQVTTVPMARFAVTQMRMK